METEEKEKNENNSEKKETELNNKTLDKKQILQDKLKKIFFEREQNKYKYNKINIPDNLKYSSDNSIDSKNNDNQIENKDNKILINEKIIEDNKNNKNEEKNNDIKENKIINNNIEEKNISNNNNIKPPSKNYVIIKPPERKKNRANEEELKNKTYTSNFINNRRNSFSKKEKDEKTDINSTNNNIIKKEMPEKKMEDINNDNNNINNDNNNINNDKYKNSKIKEKELEEEKNKIQYQQLMAKKCQNLIKLENEKKEKNEKLNNIKVIKEDKDKDIDNIKEKKDTITPEINEENEEKKRSKTINKVKEVSSIKEGTLKLLQLIKAKKNEKNIIDEKLKETKVNIKENQQQNKEENNIKNNNTQEKINVTLVKKELNDDSKKSGENIKENIIHISSNKTERDISDKNNDNNINKSDSKKEKSDLITKKQIYKKCKGTGNSCLIGNSNYHTIKSIIEKNSPIKDDMHINQKNQEKTKIILKNKINRHRTSLNITKKNYIMKPKEFKLNQEKNNINYPNNKIHIEENYNINNDNIINNNNNNYNYEKIKTYQNPKKRINKNNTNNLYQPKKSSIFINHNIKRQYDEKSLNLNIHRESPTKITAGKLTYIKKSLLNNSSNRSGHKLNNSIENISPFVNNNFDIEKIIRNNTQLDYTKYNNKINSSFKLANELGKTYYNIGNIFNLDNIEDDNNINLSNNFNINFNLDSLYNINYPIKKNKVKPSTGYNTFYSNNNFAQNNNLNNIYHQYKNNSINNNNVKRLYENRINKSLREKLNIGNNLYNSLKYEELLILEDKLNSIMISLNEEKIIYNDCFEFWNYFFNSSLYENLNIFYSNYDNEYKNMFKMSINYILISIMLSYDISFDKNKLNKVSALFREMLEFSHILLIIIYDYILNIIPYTKNNIWIDKLSKKIEKIKSWDEYDSFVVEPEKNLEKEKLNLNINFISKKIYYILNNYPSKNFQKLLSNFSKAKIHNKSLQEIHKFFLDNIFHEKDIKYSILAYNFLKLGGKSQIPNPPFLNFRKSKKYFLICDIDETLFHFKITEEDEEQGILKIRPGVFQFIEEIRQYYEIILFSEADKDYIDLIINALGNERFLYDYILCRDYISIEANEFVKDINNIGTPLDKTIIIDNMPQNFRKNKENAIYIKSFFGEENDDKALIDLIPILVNIAKSGKDVRNELGKYKEKIVNKISSNLYKRDK